MRLHDVHLSLGAQLAADGIPLHYGDLAVEYHAALAHAVLMDRSHEARFMLTGDDRFTITHRMSTNDLLNMAEGEGRPTLFTNPNARILDRATVYHRGESALAIAEPGRGEALRLYLQRNIFFNDKARIEDVTTATRLFALHGRTVDNIIAHLFGGDVPAHGAETNVANAQVFIARRKPVSESQWIIVAPQENAGEVWQAIMAAGQEYGLRAAGSLTYNTLRIRAGRPAVGRELSSDYIPLEIGLWDEVSFHKGCYTGQEIIARMESRNRLARTIVTVRLEEFLQAPAEVKHEGRAVGTLTSSVTTPDGEHLGIAVVKVQVAQVGSQYNLGDTTATVTALAGVQPAQLMPEEN